MFGMLSGSLFMKIIISLYVITAITFAYEGNWLKAMYWTGAAIITTSVLLME